MKVSGKGVAVVLVCIVVVPFFADAVLSLVVGKSAALGISTYLFAKYLQLLPWYIFYTVIMFYLIKIFNRFKNRL